MCPCPRLHIVSLIFPGRPCSALKAASTEGMSDARLFGCSGQAFSETLNKLHGPMPSPLLFFAVCVSTYSYKELTLATSSSLDGWGP